ncbi:hypothetical protein GCM10010106_04770 [Thermopolyspora flexuosa]|jgi:hypothetical protein|uniref:Uncharacterized protein DUF664 n=1 Tax=Thermopolyspora flexuosa TaxID=103836 RepID=A0A543IYW0_9ACTN|nr:DinB family protein [Thermopolyspora flexuosa]TQM75758.1 uncharacterized protein DUF664 [Thermopolyspora flexuosa]GGM61811.1 hypothetical protein GCM10010106_04770 [Thermopolyspora flexuosa]
MTVERPNGGTATSGATVLDPERADLLAALARHRDLLRYTTRDLTDEQARMRTTASELCLGGLIKHVAAMERQWANFILEGPSAIKNFADMTEEDFAEFAAQFELGPEETLAGVLEDYEAAARRMDEIIATLPDLNVAHPLPEAPWFPQGEKWTARRVVLHILAEIAQHAGHADIIRESLDGAKSQG